MTATEYQEGRERSLSVRVERLRDLHDALLADVQRLREGRIVAAVQPCIYCGAGANTLACLGCEDLLALDTLYAPVRAVA